MPVILQAASVLAAFVPPVTYLSKLLGIYSIAAFLQLALFRAYIGQEEIHDGRKNKSGFTGLWLRQ
ncbi:hypothetical protein DXZ79_10305 [Yersinia rochesterensis]|uniref:Uncharacterized protein n=1 Tax=Yersinia rochesterensis TaxID=1604335 RepID=A0A8D4SN68_9GAMM|nr:hypothetical protein DXZ79_10305 [Yersinia rochesterensis]